MPMTTMPQQPIAQPAPNLAAGTATQLVSAILQPQVLQALLAMAIGSAARQEIQVGDVQVPTRAFANMLGVLGQQAAQQSSIADLPTSPTGSPSMGESVPAYLLDGEGNLIADPAVPEARAIALFNLLQQTNQEQLAVETARPSAQLRYSARQNHLDEFYDALELTELYGEYDIWEGC
ncbi:hypothetical protein C7B76_17285 [filamentous cyanobacterium CCP2]|nr:hypothetical protein C7B76_17285 [filamentous cyanobacterium CCP2]